MSSLAELPELAGFFSYSREDDADSDGDLSALRRRIQGELRSQIGRTTKSFRLWQDTEAIPAGALWESEIKNAIAHSAFFIPIITPTVVLSPYCRFELDEFLSREASLRRRDLIFPILYIDVPALDDDSRRLNDKVLSIIAERQYFDWREFRYSEINSTEAKKAIAGFCKHIRDTIQRKFQYAAEEERKPITPQVLTFHRERGDLQSEISISDGPTTDTPAGFPRAWSIRVITKNLDGSRQQEYLVAAFEDGAQALAAVTALRNYSQTIHRDAEISLIGEASAQVKNLLKLKPGQISRVEFAGKSRQE